MSDIRKINKNIRFYKDQMIKWENRSLLILLAIIFEIIILNIIHLYFLNWNIDKLFSNYGSYYKYILILPLIIYFRFSIKEYRNHKYLMDLYRNKNT